MRCRIALSSGVSYGDDLAHVQSVALSAVKGLDCVVDKIAYHVTTLDFGVKGGVIPILKNKLTK